MNAISFKISRNTYDALKNLGIMINEVDPDSVKEVSDIVEDFNKAAAGDCIKYQTGVELFGVSDKNYVIVSLSIPDELASGLINGAIGFLGMITPHIGKAKMIWSLIKKTFESHSADTITQDPPAAEPEVLENLVEEAESVDMSQPLRMAAVVKDKTTGAIVKLVMKKDELGRLSIDSQSIVLPDGTGITKPYFKGNRSIRLIERLDGQHRLAWYKLSKRTMRSIEPQSGSWDTKFGDPTQVADVHLYGNTWSEVDVLNILDEGVIVQNRNA